MAGSSLTFSARNLRGRAVVRDPAEEHRTSTTLELFFDLIFVVAVGRVAGALHHELGEGHVERGVVGFVLMFFAVWWAWMNFTWFATAHDSDDVPYRLLTFVQITGALIFAAGVTRAFVEDDFAIVVAGYVVMRVALVVQWLRVAAHVPTQRQRALRYAVGITVLQVLWVLRLGVPHAWLIPTFVLLVAAELAVPVYAERAAGAPPFNAEHIEERYGLFTIILLGESVLSATVGFQDSFDAGGLTRGLLAVGLGGLVLAFAAWWLYFDHPGHLAPTVDTAFRWGYGHVIVFAALAALGTGIHVAAGTTGKHPHGDTRIAALAIAVPVAVFLVGLVTMLLINRARIDAVTIWPKLVGAAVILVIGLTASVPVTALGCAAVMVVLAAAMVLNGPPSAHR